MDPNIKQLFIDVHRWTKDSAYTVYMHCMCVWRGCMHARMHVEQASRPHLGGHMRFIYTYALYVWASPAEVSVLKESPLHIRRYALGGFAAGAGLTWWGTRKMAPTLSWRYAVGVSVHICTYIVHAHTQRCVCVCVSISLSLSLSLCIYMCVCVCMYVCVCVATSQSPHYLRITAT